MKRRFGILLTVLQTGSVVTADAQNVSPPGPGDRIRVMVEGRRTVGLLLSVRADTLLFQQDSMATPLPVPLPSITRLEVSRGQRSQWRTGLLVGALIGSVVGGVVTGPQGGDTDYLIPKEGGLAIGAAGGGLVGLLVGSVLRVERWQRVPAERLRVSIRVNPLGRATLGLSYAIP